MIYWAYILLGNDKTGKTTFQKEMINFISHEDCKHLNRNKEFNVVTRIGTNNTKTVSFMNRSLQESYKTLDEFFLSDFAACDACVLYIPSNQHGHWGYDKRTEATLLQCLWCVLSELL
jgi:hypothetical protein